MPTKNFSFNTNDHQTFKIIPSEFWPAIPIEIKLLRPEAKIPKYAHSYEDSGVDLCAANSGVLAVGASVLVPTGLAISIPQGYEAQVRSRSGLALKKEVIVLNSPGTIDAGYIGELGIILINHGREFFQWEIGDRIAQLVFAKVEHARFIEVEEFSKDSDRGETGFGSSGVKS